MYIAVIVGCALNNEVSTESCRAFTAPRFFETYDLCIEDALTSGENYLESIGATLQDVHCIPTDIFGRDGDV